MANKKLFELELKNEPLTSDKFALGKSGSSYKNITAANLKTWMLKDLPTPGTTLNTKVVNIGAFDMNRSSGNALASPVTQTDRSPQLRSFWRMLDTGTNASVIIYSDDQGYFDINAFDGNGPNNNRGYITVWYVD